MELSGTADPDVITTYSYNLQGQCTKVITADSIQETDYDMMGNPYRSELFSHSGKLLSATYTGYNLHNVPKWQQSTSYYF